MYSLQVNIEGKIEINFKNNLKERIKEKENREQMG